MGSLMDVGVVNSRVSHRDVFWFLFDFLSQENVYTQESMKKNMIDIYVSVSIFTVVTLFPPLG